MEQFGIYVTEDSDPALRRVFIDQGQRWDFLRGRGEAELGIRLLLGEAAGVRIASTARWPIRRAGQLIGQAAAIPVWRWASNWDREMIDVVCPATEVARVLPASVWALFLWLATRHPEPHRWSIASQMTAAQSSAPSGHQAPLPGVVVRASHPQSLQRPSASGAITRLGVGVANSSTRRRG